ncbi:hypothetical protein QBC46DRAFT_414780 [Diplogelasinospora grovesii]|uniref:Uncharacterized protein n=1 Tax=Diplogelasinospora grovesii TaxID=303347 RepID=A0AAN6RYR6_9PEZI|nr:hypothetical protein QBC46DRAFT_414780 [Diplogelasinospora grovesii]
MMNLGASPIVDNLGFSALHVAAAAGLQDVVTYLVKRGLDVNAEDTDGDTPLHYANLVAKNDEKNDGSSTGPSWSRREQTDALAEVDVRPCLPLSPLSPTPKSAISARVYSCKVDCSSRAHVRKV